MMPGRKFSITTSVLAARRCTISIDFGLVRSSARLRLLELMAIKPVAMLRPAHSLLSGLRRMSSPPGRSILMTSAPSSASW